MVHGKTFRNSQTGRYIHPSKATQIQSDPTSPPQYVEVGTNQRLEVTWEKMSKSKYNGIDPQVC